MSWSVGRSVLGGAGVAAGRTTSTGSSWAGSGSGSGGATTIGSAAGSATATEAWTPGARRWLDPQGGRASGAAPARGSRAARAMRSAPWAPGRCRHSSRARWMAFEAPRPGDTWQRRARPMRPSSGSTGRIVPWTCEMRAPGMKRPIEWRPSVTTSAGSRICELALQVRRAGRDLVGLRVAVLGRPALDHVRDEDVLPAPPDRAEEPAEQVPRSAHEGTAQPVLVDAGPFADHDHLGGRIALAGHCMGARLVETATGAGANLVRDDLERRLALGIGHAGPPPPIPARDRGSEARRESMRGSPSRARRGSRPARPRSWLHPSGGCRDTTQKTMPGRRRSMDRAGRGRRRSRRVRPPRWPAGIGGSPDHPGRRRRAPGEQLSRAVRRDRLARLDVDRLGVADVNRNSHRGTREAQLGQVQDLPAFRDDLPFLLGVAVREEHVDLGQRVERDRVRVDRGLLGLTRHMGADLALQLGQCVGTRPATPTGRYPRRPARSRRYRGGPSGPAPAASWSSSGSR